MEERQEEQEMEQMEEEGRVGRRFRGILITMGGRVEGMLDMKWLTALILQRESFLFKFKDVPARDLSFNRVKKLSVSSRLSDVKSVSG